MRGELRSLRNAVERSESELRRVTTTAESQRARLEQLAAEADRLRADCASSPADHYLAPDIERATALVQAGVLRSPHAPQFGA